MPMSDEFRTKRFAILTGIARKKGGNIVDRSYSILRKPMTVRCANDHRFKITPKNILRGLWCPQCQPLPRQVEFLTAAQRLARKHGGKCLSTSYETARLPLLWQCENRHRWEASFDNVVNKKSWCPACALASASERKTRWWRKQRSKPARRRA